MEPRKNKQRQIYPGGRYVNTVAMPDIDNENNIDIDETNDDIFSPLADYDFSGNSAFEEANIDINPNMTGDDEKRRIEAIKRAVEIAKLMDNINVQNLLNIAETVDKYLTGQN